jgi:CHAD domain-containing protein
MIRFEKYFTEQIENFKICHSNLIKEITEDDIHKLRTTLKRLRTLNLILDGLLFREKNFPTELSNLFKSAGEIRDNQIQLNILKEYETNFKRYLNYIINNKIENFKINESYQEELNSLIDKFDKVKKYHLEEEIVGNIEARTDITLDEISNISNITTENLHDVRKKIKHVFYVFMMLGIDKASNNLDELQETIGTWHDYDVAINNIKNFDNNSEVIKSLQEKRDLLFSKSLELIKKI